MSLSRPSSEVLGFRHSHRPLKSGESIPSMPSLFDQISQLSATAAVVAPEGDADNDSWIDDESEEL
ncbi:hypothetical protein [Methyloversatilis thermotolerans]|uniref:hypothetical protein n=1 Tax=Methyloversatilis thermotolerans TaxID=1346290 RepID=UPI000476CDC2|nr:hypothetical protein [Methyloversatilis thermotolerans]